MVNKLHNLNATLAILSTISSSYVHAVSIIVDASTALNVNYSNATGVFDLAAALGTSQFSTDYTINSASVAFNWIDDPDDPLPLILEFTTCPESGGPCFYSYESPPYVFMGWRVTGNLLAGYHYTPMYENITDPIHLNIFSQYKENAETVSLLLSGAFVGWPISGPQYSKTESNEATTETIDYGDVIVTSHYEITRTTEIWSYDGPFQIYTDLFNSSNSTPLNELQTTGILPYSFSFGTGDGRLTQAILLADVTFKQKSPAIPNPPTWSIIVLGLALIIMQRADSRRQSSVTFQYRTFGDDRTASPHYVPDSSASLELKPAMMIARRTHEDSTPFVEFDLER